MPFPTIPAAHSATEVEFHYEDYGVGKPIVLIHGWPLSGRSWEGQVPAPVAAGCRVITYDRRGFGRSSQPWSGYDYDSLAADLDALPEELDLRNVGTYGQERIAKLVFASAVPPYLWKSEDNPDGGVDQDLADWFTNGITGDRPAFLTEFLHLFFTAGKPCLLNKPLVGDEQIAYNLSIALVASPKGTLDCTTVFATTDFRDDFTKITVPTLVIHGDSDAIVPFEVSGKRTGEAVASSETVVIEGAPHGVTVSHREEWNRHVLEFLAK